MHPPASVPPDGASTQGHSIRGVLVDHFSEKLRFQHRERRMRQAELERQASKLLSQKKRADSEQESSGEESDRHRSVSEKKLQQKFNRMITSNFEDIVKQATQKGTRPSCNRNGPYQTHQLGELVAPLPSSPDDSLRSSKALLARNSAALHKVTFQIRSPSPSATGRIKNSY